MRVSDIFFSQFQKEVLKTFKFSSEYLVSVFLRITSLHDFPFQFKKMKMNDYQLQYVFLYGLMTSATYKYICYHYKNHK